MVVGVDGTVLRNRRGFGRFARNAVAALVAADPDTRYVLYVDSASEELVHVPGAEIRVIELGAPPALAASDTSRRSPADLFRVSRAITSDAPGAFLFTSLLTYVPVRSVPLVVGLHDAIARGAPQLVFSRRRDRVLWFLKERDAIRRAAGLFTVSEAARDALATTLGVAPARLVVVPEAPDPAFAAANGSSSELDLPVPDGPFILCAAGGISPHKNIETLLEAYALLGDGAPALVVVGALGDETYTSSAGVVRDRARALGIDGRTSFPGFVPDEVLAALYRRALFVVNPSRAEGFGLTAVEAAACGAAVALSEIPAHRETLGGAAVFFDPTSAHDLAARMREMTESDVLRLEVADRCRRAVASLTWSLAGARLAELIHEVASGARRG